MSKRIFSGIQPSGNIHLGNYLGALKQWKEIQDEAECIFCIVDLHAITVPQDPKVLQEKILELTALYLACGIDPQKSKIFVQSSRPEHSELAWILNCNTSMGELSRMTQFKEKSENKTNYSVGLFDYPALMAADILLYQTTHVPVGEDQKQHIELTRDLAQRINHKYSTRGVEQGQIFTIPEPIICKTTARIMGLDDAAKKMSKSAQSAANYIALTDEPEVIKQKIKRAVTDSGSEIKAGADKPAITNLLNIFSGVTDKSVEEIEQEFAGKQYGEFKEALAEAVVAYLEPIQAKYKELRSNEAELRKILDEGSKAVEPIAQKTLQEVKKKVGLG
jgi:tryptophanyl-tRNA synthetase